MTKAFVQRIDPTFEGEGRFYELDGVRYMSVTTGIDKGLSKSEVINANLLPGIKENPHEALERIERLEKNKETGRSKGTLVHALIEEQITGNIDLTISDDDRKLVSKSVDQFKAWCDVYQPRFILTEFFCFNTRYKYAGTADAVFWTEEYGVSLADWKTTRPGRHGHGIYPETALQLNAYAFADFIVVDEKIIELPTIDTLLGVNIRPQSWRVVECEFSDRVFDTFAALLTVANFKAGDGFHFLGRPVQG